MLSAPLFHFFTLVTKTDQYEAMRDSLAKVGFDETNAVFTVLDNRKENAHEPFSAITAAVKAAEAPYVVFCHQDLLFYHGPDELLRAIGEVDAIDPNWAVLGNAGRTPSMEGVFCVDDHSQSHDDGVRPSRVLSLDENFLVIRRGSGVGCSPGLSGFHLYATDLVLNAYSRGMSAYVIEYRLMHLGSSLDYRGLLKLARRFRNVWRSRIGGAVIMTPATIVIFARSPLLFSAANRIGFADNIAGRYRLLRTLDYLLRHKRPDWLPMGRYPTNDPRGPRLNGALVVADRILRRGRPLWNPRGLYEEHDAAELTQHWERVAARQRRLEEEEASRKETA